MQINKYRMVKQMTCQGPMDMYVFIETVGSKIWKFMKENDVADGDLIAFDLRLWVEKNEK